MYRYQELRCNTFRENPPAKHGNSWLSSWSPRDHPSRRETKPVEPNRMQPITPP
jgi:hypothetical protein